MSDENPRQKDAQALAKKVNLPAGQGARWRRKQRKTLPWYQNSLFPSGLLTLVISISWLLGVPFHGFEGRWTGLQICGAIALFWTVIVLMSLGWSTVLTWLGVEIVAGADLKTYAKKNFGLTVVWAVLAAPLTEEFAFRYGILGFFSEDAVFSAALASSIAFGLAHKGHKVVKVIMGLGFCWLYVGSGSIWVSILAHMGLNLFAVWAVLFKLRSKPKNPRLEALMTELEDLEAEHVAKQKFVAELRTRLDDGEIPLEELHAWRRTAEDLLRRAVARQTRITEIKQEIEHIKQKVNA